MARHLALAGVALGLAFLLGAPLLAAVSAEDDAAGVPLRPFADGPLAPREAEGPPARDAAPAVAPTPAFAQIATRPGRLDDQPAAAPSAPPVRVRAPGARIDVAVVPVGVEASGDMEIPDDVRTAGWYRYGPVPGETGSAVVTAHVDSRRQGPGPFERLRLLEPGDDIEVELGDGTTRDFLVVGRERIAKERVPLDAVFRRTGSPTLTLVTCGGDFDASARRYADNVVVTAVPS